MSKAVALLQLKRPPRNYDNDAIDAHLVNKDEVNFKTIYNLSFNFMICFLFTDLMWRKKPWLVFTRSYPGCPMISTQLATRSCS